jgi:hypothetical protein
MWAFLSIRTPSDDFIELKLQLFFGVPLTGRKFGNSFSWFSDATLEIGPGGVAPFFAGLCASIEPHMFFGARVMTP